MILKQQHQTIYSGMKFAPKKLQRLHSSWSTSQFHNSAQMIR
uniref:Uncharacterized protein n=1 Tax=Anguilla anguilla TaxID=7936 RepID=A0A0E9RFM5_ANGAN